MEKKIIINKAKCKKCQDIIESKSTYDLKRCSCGSIAVDGGLEYLKRIGNLDDIIELSNKSYNDFFIVASQDVIQKNEVIYLNEIKKMIIDYYEKIGLNFDYEKRYILKTTFSSPMFAPKSMNPKNENDYILLSIEDFSYWCQVIYQLSHELTHCFIYCNNSEENKKIRWIEETICEAMSLYFLDYFSNFWNKCKLSYINPNYCVVINAYLVKLLKRKGTNKLTNCSSIIELKLINETCQEKRKDRMNEMHKLKEIVEEDNIIGLIKYKDYVKQGDIIMDLDSYEEDFPDNKAVKYLCDLQRNILLKNNGKIN